MKASTHHRRDFLKRSTVIASTFAIAGGTRRVLGANDRIRVAVAGVTGRGRDHVAEFVKLDGVEVAYLVDPDTRAFKRALGPIEGSGQSAPECLQDVRQALDDKDLDVLSIATPNHWHALMTVWGCQAGKDVYVEKPCSHEAREGQVALEAARKYGRMVQHGTQGRSSAQWARVAELVRRGHYGKLLVSRGLVYKPRESIGFRPVEPVPAEVDFNLWLGPAPEAAFHRNLVHYNWHWFWPYGNGDIGNQGVHQMDIARWMIPGAGLPQSVVSLGGRFGYEDQGETPNTLLSVLDYGEDQPLLVFEVRGLPTEPYYNQSSGNTLHFEEGILAGNNRFYPRGEGSGEPLPDDVEAARGPGGENHFANFIAAVRSRQASDLNAEIAEGHLSASLCHLPNISYRLGEPETLGSVGRHFEARGAASEALDRMKAHLASQGLSTDALECRMGRRLQLDPAAGTIRDDAEASALLTREYRPGFVMPESV